MGNIDWPSRPGLPAAAQRVEMRRLLDSARALHLNALLLQVRPSADALYPSALEPWTEYLTGTQGQDPGWDPLAEPRAPVVTNEANLAVWRVEAQVETCWTKCSWDDLAPVNPSRRRE